MKEVPIMKKLAQVCLWAGACLNGVAGFAIGLDVAGGRALWPWPDGPLSYIFISSMLLSQATALAWIARSLDLHAAKGGILGFFAMSAGLTALMAERYQNHGNTLALYWAIACAGLAACSAFLWWVARSDVPVDRGPTPAVVRGSFLMWSAALALVMVMLLARMPVVFPWSLKPESSVAFGLMFSASAVYYFDGFLRPSWSNAIGQLLAFLVYDLVLIVPWMLQLATARGGFFISLVIYLTVLIWSGLLAIFFLFMHPTTRIIGRARSASA